MKKTSGKTALTYSDSDSLVVHNGIKFCTKYKEWSPHYNVPGAS